MSGGLLPPPPEVGPVLQQDCRARASRQAGLRGALTIRVLMVTEA